MYSEKLIHCHYLQYLSVQILIIKRKEKAKRYKVLIIMSNGNERPHQ